MKIWLWLILLGAGSTATYLILSDGSSSKKSQPAEIKSEIDKENQEVAADQPPPASNAEAEIILPMDAGPKPTRKSLPLGDQHDKEVAAHAEDDGSNSEDARDLRDLEDLHSERDRLLDRSRDLPQPTRRSRNRASDTTTAPSPSTPVSLASGTSSATSTSGNSTSSKSSSSGLGGSLGGSFPALPASSPSPSSGSSASNTSSSGKTFSPTGTTPRSNPNDPKTVRKPLKTPGTVDGTEVAGRETPTDELIKPNEIPRTPNETESPNNAHKDWAELMQIPAGSTGLLISPRTVAVAIPATIAAEAESLPTVTMLLGATWKSNFDAADKPTVQVLRECPADPAAECVPHQIPTGGPTVTDYLYQDAAHQEDMVPDSKDSFEIGCVVVGTQKDALGKDVPQTECALHVYPGSVPGKYQIVLFAKNAKHTGSFEVVAAAAASGSPNATIESSASPRTYMKALTRQKSSAPH